MRQTVCMFFDLYQPFHEYKDPGQILLGLKEIGVDAAMVTFKKGELTNYKSPFPLIQILPSSKGRELAGAIEPFDVAIIYSWLSPNYNFIVEIAKSLNKSVIIKSDSDGRFGATRHPKNRSIVLKVKSSPFSRASAGYIRRLIFPSIEKKQERKRIEQIALSDAVVIESPDAAQNLSFLLFRNGRGDLIKKIHMIPNPVTPDFVNSEIRDKGNTVVSISRWEDKAQKNPEGLIMTLRNFLGFKENWNAIIIGSGDNIIRTCMKNLPSSIQERVSTTGILDHTKIKDYLLRSKIFFMPSRWESFGIAAAEALCCGLTLVGSPIESLRFLTMQGFSGNVSYSWDPDALCGSLIFEANRWEKGEVDYINIAEFWRKKLNRQSIARQYWKIIESLKVWGA